MTMTVYSRQLKYAKSLALELNQTNGSKRILLFAKQDFFYSKQVFWLTVHGVKEKEEYMPRDTHIMQTIFANKQELSTPRSLY